MDNRVADTEYQDQRNHRLAAPDTEFRAAKTLAGFTGQQRRNNGGPDGRGKPCIANGVQETVRPQQATDNRRDKRQQCRFKTSHCRVIKAKQIRQIVKQTERDPEE